MGFTEKLIALLRPLGVYTFREGSFSLGEWQALGTVLDEMQSWQTKMQKESLVLTAEDEGLSQMEALFQYGLRPQGTQARRAAIAGFLQIGGDGFTPEALNRCLQACGVPCLVEEREEVNHVQVRFPAVMGVPEGFLQMQHIIEDILPCQLDIAYYFRYCTWQETQRYGLRWENLGTMSWMDWMLYHEGPLPEPDET